MKQEEKIDTENAEFQDALRLIQYTRNSVFLTGKAGTGKSTFIKHFMEEMILPVIQKRS